MNHYDPLAPRSAAKTLDYRLGSYTDSDAGRTQFYGRPNMGGEPFHRRNEMPSRSDWYGRSRDN